MDIVIFFFRDVLDGPLYWIITIISFFIILFLLGFILDRMHKNNIENLKKSANIIPVGGNRIDLSSGTTTIMSEGMQEEIKDKVDMEPVIQKVDNSTSSDVVIIEDSGKTEVKEEPVSNSVKTQDISGTNASDFVIFDDSNHDSDVIIIESSDSDNKEE